MAGGIEGRVYEYLPGLVAFEFGGKLTEKFAPNVVVFIGGLGDGLLTVPYVTLMAEKVAAMESARGNWVVVQALISSSYQGWGTGSLKRDAQELSQLVKYLRSGSGGSRKTVVLMGHLTGCQDTLEYVSKLQVEGIIGGGELKVDGAILQAPVSDREAVQHDLGDRETQLLLEQCRREYLDQGNGGHILPQRFRKALFGTPITAYRFNSLVLVRGDDDFFSSDLDGNDHRQSFGKVEVPLLVLFGSKDEFVPEFVDREKLVDSWKKATDPKYWSPLSKVLKGASHNVGPLSDPGAVEDLLDTVGKFISSI